MVKRLTDDDRRKMILEALSPGGSMSEVSRRYGIQRNTLYEHLNRAMSDPKGRWREAEAEASFRRKVWELVR